MKRVFAVINANILCIASDKLSLMVLSSCGAERLELNQICR